MRRLLVPISCCLLWLCLAIGASAEEVSMDSAEIYLDLSEIDEYEIKIGEPSEEVHGQECDLGSFGYSSQIATVTGEGGR
jgi:hypothetical protein